MSDTATRAIAAIESTAVKAGRSVAASASDDGGKPAAAGSERRAPAVAPIPAPTASTVVSASELRTTALSFHIDPVSQRVTVRVIDRESGKLVRSFPLIIPGRGDEATDTQAERGALVDATA